MADFFTSDTHYGHCNIIKYCNRPFETVDKMDEILIDNINKTVGTDDTLWHLGDFCFGPKDPTAFIQKAENYRNRINCKNIMLIYGNHDPDPLRSFDDKATRFARLFTKTYHMLVTQINHQPVTLCHYPMRVWHHSHKSFMLFGHVHGRLFNEDINSNKLTLDVGVDSNNYQPWNFKDIQSLMHKKLLNTNAL